MPEPRQIYWRGLWSMRIKCKVASAIMMALWGCSLIPWGLRFLVATLFISAGKGNVQEYENTVDQRPAFLEPDSPTYRLVQFYDPSTENCGQYQPVFQKLAEQLVNYTSLLQIHSVSCARHETLCETETSGQLPSYVVYLPNEKFGTPLLIQELHPFTVLDRLGLLSDKSVVRAFVDDQGYFAESETEDEEFLRELESVYSVKRQFAEVDIHLAIEMLLRHNLFKSSNVVDLSHRNETHLKPSVVTALKSWLQLLRKTVIEIPDQMTTSRSAPSRARLLVTDILNNLMYISRSESYLLSILEEHQSATGDWSAGCSMTMDGGSSYLCAMWKLLFRAAIGVNDYNRAAVQNPIDLIDVKQTIKDTESIVGMLCAGEQECIDIVASPDSYGDDLISWLVSLRQKIQHLFRKLQKEMLKLPFTEQDSEATLFPTKSHCPRCWDKHGDLNRTVTISYLELEFGHKMWWKELIEPYDIVYPEEDELDDEGEYKIMHEEL